MTSSRRQPALRRSQEVELPADPAWLLLMPEVAAVARTAVLLSPAAGTEDAVRAVRQEDTVGCDLRMSEPGGTRLIPAGESAPSRRRSS